MQMNKGQKGPASQAAESKGINIRYMVFARTLEIGATLRAVNLEYVVDVETASRQWRAE